MYTAQRPACMFDSHAVMFHPARSRSERIEAGHYDVVHASITEKHFPASLSVPSEPRAMLLALLRVNGHLTTQDIKNSMTRCAYVPLTIEFLLAFGECHPEAQRKFPIVALASFTRLSNGETRFPCLRMRGDLRALSWISTCASWRENCRFLVLRSAEA